MMTTIKALALLAIFAGLSACSGNSGPGSDVTFATNDIVGLRAGQSAAGTPELTLGWGEQNYASVTTESSNGDPLMAKVGVGTGNESQDALSVIGTFDGDLDLSAGEGTAVVNRMFSVGGAAAAVGAGIRCALSRGTSSTCTGPGNWTPGPGS